MFHPECCFQEGTAGMELISLPSWFGGFTGSPADFILLVDDENNLFLPLNIWALKSNPQNHLERFNDGQGSQYYDFPFPKLPFLLDFIHQPQKENTTPMNPSCVEPVMGVRNYQTTWIYFPFGGNFAVPKKRVSNWFQPPLKALHVCSASTKTSPGQIGQPRCCHEDFEGAGLTDVEIIRRQIPLRDNLLAKGTKGTKIYKKKRPPPPFVGGILHLLPIF